MLLNGQQYFTGKYTTCKIHTKLHPAPKVLVFQEGGKLEWLEENPWIKARTNKIHHPPICVWRLAVIKSVSTLVYMYSLPGIFTMRDVFVPLTSFITPTWTQYLPKSWNMWFTIKLQEFLCSMVGLQISPGGRLHCFETHHWKDTGRLVEKIKQSLWRNQQLCSQGFWNPEYYFKWQILKSS